MRRAERAAIAQILIDAIGNARRSPEIARVSGRHGRCDLRSAC
jgi:hypothetical protein